MKRRVVAPLLAGSTPASHPNRKRGQWRESSSLENCRPIGVAGSSPAASAMRGSSNSRAAAFQAADVGAIPIPRSTTGRQEVRHMTATHVSVVRIHSGCPRDRSLVAHDTCLSRKRTRVRIPPVPPLGRVAQIVEQHAVNVRGGGASPPPLAMLL